MTESGSRDDLIDRVVERVLRGEDPDVEGMIAAAPELPPATQEALRKIAGNFGGENAPAFPLSRAMTVPFEKLGPYKLLSPMGEGGMGMVFLAEHEFLKRRVALKLIRPELVFSEATRRRFHREAMSIAKLRHDNIVSVYDAGEHDGVTYLALELVEGQGLDERLRAAERASERMDVITAVRHARDIALALQTAHEAGIVHRDVKPSNVRITPEGRALLLDFGLSWTEGMASLSSVGHFAGTPQYASPEQIEMSSADVDARTDVYSLGITLYECLTGKLPFAGANMKQLFHQILVRDPPEPRKQNELVDERLNAIVMRAIDKQREKRFASAREMADALDEWLRSAARTAPAPRRRPSRLRVTLAATAVIALLLAGWLAIRRGESAPAAATPRAQPVAAAASRNRTSLLGARDAAFNERFNAWEPLVGGGTFGADEDGLGVIGTSNDGLTTRARVLPGGNGSVGGRIQPLETKPGVRTRAAGVGVEFSNGRAVALLFVSAAEGRDACLCELVRDPASRWTRGPELECARGAVSRGAAVTFELRWNDTDTELVYGEASARAMPLLVPRDLRGGGHPSRFLLIVEQGNARFEDLVLDES